jgi:hypothetical protein
LNIGFNRVSFCIVVYEPIRMPFEHNISFLEKLNLV